MTLKEIFEEMKRFVDNNEEIMYVNDEGEDIEVVQEFDELQNKIFADNQTYFSWFVDSDTFRIDRAFDSVLEYVKENNLKLKDYYIDYLYDDRLLVLIETEI